MPGQRIADRFEIVRKIGEGAFAVVYRARDTNSRRDVALKILKEVARTDSEIIERFRREAFTVSSLDSPHVVALYDFGTSGDDLFIAMEYVEGPTMRDLMSRPWSAGATHLVVGQIAQAVDVAHKHNVVHRDLKPENVVLVKGASSRGRQVKVLDFGLAKAADLEKSLGLEPLTQAGMCFGTPQYMAPEQMQGRPATASTDLWALAVIAYEMVAGRLPWDGTTPRDVFLAVLSTPLPKIHETHSTIRRVDELNRFFARALSRTLAERPADAGAFFSGFAEALLGSGAPAREAIFSGIVSAEFDAPEADEATDVGNDPTAGGATFPGATVPAHNSRRRLQSGWMASLPNVPVAPAASAEEDDERARTLEDFDQPTYPRPRNASDDLDRADTLERSVRKAAPLYGSERQKIDVTELVRKPPARAGGTVRLALAVAIVIAMMVVGAAVGYWFGTHRPR